MVFFFMRISLYFLSNQENNFSEVCQCLNIYKTHLTRLKNREILGVNYIPATLWSLIRPLVTSFKKDLKIDPVNNETCWLKSSQLQVAMTLDTILGRIECWAGGIIHFCVLLVWLLGSPTFSRFLHFHCIFSSQLFSF